MMTAFFRITPIQHEYDWIRFSTPSLKFTVQPSKRPSAFGVNAKGPKAKQLNRIHEKAGARIARRILTQLDYDRLSIDEIARIIERHDSGKNPQTIEEKLVKDADRRWRFSKIGYDYEMKRQNTTHEVRYRFLTRNLGNWFFTQTAQDLADEELQVRVNEHASK
jgi:hypothetical protein